MSGDETSRRLPPWLTRRLPAGGHGADIARLLEDLRLSTVCDGAHCPNRGECFARGTATFMILGDTCTRNCRFCAVEAAGELRPPREDEPAAVAEAAARMQLRHVVITSVTRDDLPDGGAAHFARTITAVRARLPEATVEVLVPDFQGDRAAIDTVVAADPNVFNHNVETVPRLYADIRFQADYARSLDVLRHARESTIVNRQSPIFTKSGFMVGLGETPEEVTQVMHDLREAHVDILTIGQYLAPSAKHAPVVEFIRPERFDAWRDEGVAMGFEAVAAGPFVRSSYLAEDVLKATREQ